MKLDTMWLYIDSKGYSNAIKNMISNIDSEPYIVKEALLMIDDNNPISKVITENNKKALINMVIKYFNSGCYSEYLMTNDKYKDILKYNKLDIYSIECESGEREATIGEINNGVRGLKRKVRYPIGEEKYKLISLLYWTFNGNRHFFIEAGNKLEYEDGKCKTTVYDMILNCSSQLIELMDWVGTEEFNNDIAKANKFVKKKGYKHASFSSDEIVENISVKQLIMDIKNRFPRNSDRREFRRALALAIKASENIKNVTPMDISFMRDAYEEFKKLKEIEYENTEEEDNRIKNMCERVFEALEKGEIGNEHFALKIARTMQRDGYRKCSKKQYAIMQNTVEKVVNTNVGGNGSKGNTVNIDTKPESINNYSTLSDILDN